MLPLLALMLTLMAVTPGHVRSDNKIVQGGKPWFEGQRVGATAVDPGALVVRGASDNLVIPAGDNVVAFGVADVIFSERVPNTLGGQKVGQQLAVGSAVRVAKGDFLFRGILTTSQTIVKGASLSSVAAGRLKVAATGQPVVAIAEESVTTTGAEAPILARFIQGAGVSA